MKIKPEMQEDYAEYAEINGKNEYSRAIILYGEKWAELMEAEMSKGVPLKDCWKQTSHSADVDGITGFMYGAAVSTLARYWVHGEELRILHNADYGVTEDRARGGVVNPAIFTLGE